MTKYYCHDKYKTQRTCDKILDSYLLALKFVPDWFVTSNITEELDNTKFSDDYTVFGDIDFDFVTFFINGIGLISIILILMMIILIY